MLTTNNTVLGERLNVRTIFLQLRVQPEEVIRRNLVHLTDFGTGVIVHVFGGFSP